MTTIGVQRRRVGAAAVLAGGSAGAVHPLTAGTLQPAAAGTGDPPTQVVQPVDTLSHLAARHATSVPALAALNRLQNPDRIRIGQTLAVGTAASTAVAIPAAAATAGSAEEVVHVVRPGETLSEIAERYRVRVADLARSNGIGDPNVLWSGQTLRIAGAAAPPAAVPVVAAALAADAGEVVHTVAAGEVLSAIAARYGVSVDRLVAANGLSNPDLIVPGQRLTVPALLPVELFGTRAGSEETAALVPLFERWAGANGIPADLVMAVAYHESGWYNGAVSPAGAQGIGQLMPDTARFISEVLIGQPLDPAVPEHNIRMSARYLRHLLDQTGGDTRTALAAYYQGLASVRARGWYDDTKQYVANVEALRPWFR